MKLLTCLILVGVLLLSNCNLSLASSGGVNATVSVARGGLSGFGRLLLSDLSNIVKIWIEDNEKCDINKDKVCNTEDFSILMYHIQK